MQRIGVACCMLRSGVGLSVCHMITRRCLSMQVDILSHNQEKTEVDTVEGCNEGR